VSKLKVATLEKTCEACPSQWEGVGANGEDIYIRYRWGTLWLEARAAVLNNLT
jgi:hypothetical protein